MRESWLKLKEIAKVVVDLKSLPDRAVPIPGTRSRHCFRSRTKTSVIRKKSRHFVSYSANRYTGSMTRKASVIIEKDEHGFYAWCPELKGCQSQGDTLEQAIANIKEAIELYLETLPEGERDVLLSREILTTAVEVNG